MEFVIYIINYIFLFSLCVYSYSIPWQKVHVSYFNDDLKKIANLSPVPARVIPPSSITSVVDIPVISCSTA